MYQEYKNSIYTFTTGGVVYTLPEHTKHGLFAYAEDKVPIGSFLFAVLSNNLMNTIAHADILNIQALPAITAFLYNEMPGNCWGSEEIVKEWLHK